VGAVVKFPIILYATDHMRNSTTFQCYMEPRLPERVSAHLPVCVVAPRRAGVSGSVPTALPNQRVEACPRFTYLPMCVASIPAARPMLVAMSPSRGRVCLVLL